VGRVFASRYAADVAGAVFVDASHPAQFSTACVPACLPHQVVERSASLYRTTPWLASLGALRLGSQLGLVPFAQASAGLTPRESQIIAAEFTKTAYWRTSAAEFRGIPESAAQAAAVRSLGSRPLRVLVAGHTYYTDEIKAFTGDINPDQVSRSWLTLERDLARLSTRSSLEVVPEASHVSLITDPRYAARVVAAVKDVVQEVRTAPTSR